MGHFWQQGHSCLSLAGSGWNRLGSKVDDSQLHSNAEGLVLIPVSNPATEPVPFPVGESIGQAELLDLEDGARVDQIVSSWDVPGEDGAQSVACLEARAEADAATTE